MSASSLCELTGWRAAAIHRCTATLAILSAPAVAAAAAAGTQAAAVLAHRCMLLHATPRCSVALVSQAGKYEALPPSECSQKCNGRGKCIKAGGAWTASCACFSGYSVSESLSHCAHWMATGCSVAAPSLIPVAAVVTHLCVMLLMCITGLALLVQGKACAVEDTNNCPLNCLGAHRQPSHHALCCASHPSGTVSCSSLIIGTVSNSSTTLCCWSRYYNCLRLLAPCLVQVVGSAAMASATATPHTSAWGAPGRRCTRPLLISPASAQSTSKSICKCPASPHLAQRLARPPACLCAASSPTVYHAPSFPACCPPACYHPAGLLVCTPSKHASCRQLLPVYRHAGMSCPHSWHMMWRRQAAQRQLTPTLRTRR